MIDILPWAMAVTFLVMSAVTAVVYLIDRFAGDRYVRERHDLALAAFVLAPLVFVLVFRPGDGVPVDLSSALSADASQIEVPVSVAAGPAVADRPGNGGQASGAPIAEAQRTSYAGNLPVSEADIARLLDMLPILWAAGALISLAILARDFVSLMGLKAAASPIPQHNLPALSRQLSVRRTPRLSTPLLAGYFQSSILVPWDFRLDEAGRDVLEHEIAHYVRADHWTVLGLKIMGALFWWLVPLKVLESVISANREILCDAHAARQTGQPRRLAHTLLDVAVNDGRSPRLAVSALGSRSTLAKRIRFLAHKDHVGRRGHPLALPACLALLGSVAVMVTPNLGAAASATEQTGGEVYATTERWFESVEAVEISRFDGIVHLNFVEGLTGAQVSAATGVDVELAARAGTLLVTASRSNSNSANRRVPVMLRLPASTDVSIQDSSVTVVSEGLAGRIRAAGNRRLDGSVDVVRGLDIDHSGAGEFTVRRLLGEDETSLSLSGSGNLIILGGETRFLRAGMDGPGFLIFGGVAENARLTGDGDGSVYVGRVTGSSSLDINAHGTIGRRSDGFSSRDDALAAAAEAAGRDL